MRLFSLKKRSFYGAFIKKCFKFSSVVSICSNRFDALLYRVAIAFLWAMLLGVIGKKIF